VLLFLFTDIVEIKHIMLPPSPRDFKDIYVVFELMETDLHQVRAHAVNSATGQLRSSVSTQRATWPQQQKHIGQHSV
jgi:hypothetical protein